MPRLALAAFGTAIGGVFLAALFYWLAATLNPGGRAPASSRRSTGCCGNKWWFDELYDVMFVQPTMFVSRLVAGFDRRVDRLASSTARPRVTVWFREAGDLIADRDVRRWAREPVRPPGPTRWASALRPVANRPACGNT